MLRVYWSWKDEHGSCPGREDMFALCMACAKGRDEFPRHVACTEFGEIDSEKVNSLMNSPSSKVA